MSALPAPVAASATRAPARPAPVLRRCACGGSGGPTGECAECRKKRLQRNPSSNAPSIAGPSTDAAPGIVHDVLRSPGTPLDAQTRAFMEPRFGHSFADVRVHADAHAAESATAVGARAYAVGRDVVFGGAMYAPASMDGRKLIAHELAHVVQQSGSPSTLSPSLEVGPVDAPEEREADAAAERVVSGGPALGTGDLGRGSGAVRLRRTPGTDAPDSWAALAPDGIEVSDARRPAAEEAIRRMLTTASGAQLVNSLWRTFCRSGTCRTRIRVRFLDQLPQSDRELGAAGHFEPDQPGAREYRIRLRNELPSAGTVIGGSWPGGSPVDIAFTHSDPESGMAETVYHELLHVWYVNTQQDSLYPTGHGDVQRGEIAPLFLERIQGFMRDIDALEDQVHAQERQRQREAEEARARQAATATPSPERPEPAPPAEHGPRIVGGEVSAQVGGAGGVGRGGAFTGIVGADLILGNIYSLRLGARGVYLTPDHLLAGGTVGFRVLQSDPDRPGSDRVERPLFFDVEAGILAELTPSDTTRFTNSFAGYASVGVGQEFGQQGPRFFWRVGGFVVVSDRAGSSGTGGTGASTPPPVAGGGTAGVGVRF
jgi:hypothetical protein